MKLYEGESLDDSSLHTFSKLGNFRFPAFSTKYSVTLGEKRENNKLQKILGSLLLQLRKYSMDGTVIKTFITESSYKRILGNICLLTNGYFTEKSCWVTLNRRDYVWQTDNSRPSSVTFRAGPLTPIYFLTTNFSPTPIPTATAKEHSW